MLLLPDGTISFDGPAGFDERDSSQPPALVAFAALALESQQAVCCSNVKPSQARLHSFLSSMPPATVNIVHSKHRGAHAVRCSACARTRFRWRELALFVAPGGLKRFTHLTRECSKRRCIMQRAIMK